MKLLKFLSFFLILNIFSENLSITMLEKKPFVILITSYNNEKYAEKNILSVIKQCYSNYRVIFINDCSSDNTLAIVEKTLREHHAEDLVTIINNQERKLGLRNYYEAIVNYTKDNEIIVCVDGDDFLANKKVLLNLNKVYSNPKEEVWLTYGQLISLNTRRKGWNAEIPEEFVKKNAFREIPCVTTHLRTFYSWLFKRINKNDFMYQGKFFDMTWDLAFMFPMLEMSGGRFAFIKKIVYIYNDNNPINDFRVNSELQLFYDRYIRHLKKYKPLQHSAFDRCSNESCIICNTHISDEIYQ